MADELAYKDGDLCSATLMSHATTSYLTAAHEPLVFRMPQRWHIGKIHIQVEAASQGKQHS